MNESGQSVASLMRYFAIKPDALLVVHDDLAGEPLGDLRDPAGPVGVSGVGHLGLSTERIEPAIQTFSAYGPGRHAASNAFEFQTGLPGT